MRIPITVRVSGAGCQLLPVCALVLFFQSCDESQRKPETLAKSEESESRPTLVREALLKRAERDQNAPLFYEVPGNESGISFQNPLDTSHPLKRLYQSGFACGGVAIGDLDGDELPEIFFASGPESNRLYKQSGKLRFDDVTETAGVGGGNDWGAGVTFVDIDGDRDLDIYLCNYNSPNALFINESAMVFREAAAEYGLDIVDASLMPSFCDYDNDGDLDCWLLANRLYRAGGRPSEPPYFVDKETGRAQVKPEYADYYAITYTGGTSYSIDDYGRPDSLLRNDDGKFINASATAGITLNGFGLSATWWDFNEDGWMDIYVCNDFLDPDRLFKNNGDGTFTNVIEETMNATPWFSMGSDIGDVDNNGRIDLVALDMAATTHYKSKMGMGEMGRLRERVESVRPRQLMRNVCYLNTGTSRFIESAQLSGISNTDWSWAPKLADFDEDGRIDLFVSNGMSRNFNNSDYQIEKSKLIGKTQWDHYENTPPMPEQNKAFKNLGDLEFEDTSKKWGLDHTGMSYGAAYGDLDRDGDLDLVIANLDEPASIYRNDSFGSNTIVIQLAGATKNTFGIGVSVRIETESGAKHVRQLVPATGFLSCNLPEVTIGMGSDTHVNKMTITWPGGSMQEFTDLEAGNRYTISEEPAIPSFAASDTPLPLFLRSKVLDGLVHTESSFEDFDRQPLLPNKLSQLGPGLAWADVDNDGDDDLYIGGSRNIGGAVLLNEGPDSNGVCQFVLPSTKPFIDDAQSENMGCLFLDADGDKDLDLFVANGSYEYKEGDPLLQNNLYLNDGSGNFVKAPQALPDLRDSSSCVVGADFDRDGDEDLFIGSRVIPGKYPEPAQSRLLINEGNSEGAKFVERNLSVQGLVTGALWSDADNDGWLDLLVTSEWGPIRFFKNQNGTLEEKTKEADLGDLPGWWNSIAGADIDGDGDIDYAVANWGLNTKYHASPKKPALLYYGDYTGSGKKSLVEAKYEEGVLLPIRGKSCSTGAMPHLAEKFGTFHSFASASLQEIYSPASLKTAQTFTATTLESGILINDGNARFRFAPLPNLAQISPAFGLTFLDANADGMIDLFVAQNFFGPQFETGPYSSGLSILMIGRGDGTFDPMLPDKSGIIVPGDATASTLVDFNRDGRLDIAVAQNNGPLLTFESSSAESGKFLKVHFGKNSAGARILAVFESGKNVVQEVYSGSGYLSQNPRSIVLTLGTDKVKKLVVRWPDGKTTVIDDIATDTTVLTIH
ncbi:MAG: hypothetical protein ACI9R3_000237 [Verrucomicrobiales bacterium]|jgi:hypothetical protein